MLKNCLLLDMSNLMYKYLYVYSNLSIKAKKNGILYNKPMGHIFGVVDLISDLSVNNPNTDIVIAVDGSSPRRELSDEYKDRLEFNDNYSVGENTDGRYNVHKDKKLIVKLLGCFKNVYYLYDENMEADDMIYNFVNKFKDNYEVINIVSEDRDLLVNVSDKCNQYTKIRKGSNLSNLGDENLYNLERVKIDYFGLYGKYLVTYKDMVGDSSDNIKGYYRIPKKVAGYFARAIKIKNGELKKNKDVIDTKYENIVDELAEYKNEMNISDNALTKWLEVIKENREILLNNDKLVRPIEKEITVKQMNMSYREVKELARKYQMNKLIRFINWIEINGEDFEE